VLFWLLFGLLALASLQLSFSRLRIGIRSTNFGYLLRRFLRGAARHLNVLRVKTPSPTDVGSSRPA
jgi:hypothetical protein